MHPDGIRYRIELLYFPYFDIGKPFYQSGLCLLWRFLFIDFSEFYGQPVGISKLGIFPEKDSGSFFLVLGQLRWHSKKKKTTSG
jgi:hypothetical protein